MDTSTKKPLAVKVARADPRAMDVATPSKAPSPKSRRVPSSVGVLKSAVKVVSATQTPLVVGFAGSPSELIARMRSGTPARELPGIASALGISQDRLFELLRLPKSTVKGRISTDATLSATEQDRVYRATRALQRAVEVFEDDDSARTWLSVPNRSLGGEVPLALLDTEVGYELVLDTLGRIEYGVVS